MKVLQLCHKMPYPPHDGGAYSLYQTALGLLSQDINVKVFAINTPKNRVKVNDIPADFRERTRFECSMVNTRVNPIKAGINLLSNRSYFVERFWSKEWNDQLINILRKEEFDVIQLEHLYMCSYIDTIKQLSKAMVVLRPQNVENNLWHQVIKFEPNPLKAKYLKIATKRLMTLEMQMAQKVDGILAISDEDATVFTKYAPATPVVSVPFGFNFNKTKNYDINKQYQAFPIFYHLGSMDWQPNIQGIKWFIEEVLPFICSEYPEFKLKIAGKKMPQWIYKRQSKNLEAEGEVKDSMIYQEDKALMIVPLLSGGGLRVKIIEGMALGKTIISTSIGARGIPFTDQKNLLIANTPQEFAIQINKCRHSKVFCQMIGKHARQFAMEKYDFNQTAKRMIRFYNNLLH